MFESEYAWRYWSIGINIKMSRDQRLEYEELAEFYKIAAPRVATRCKKRLCLACGSSQRVARAFIIMGIEVFACRDCDVEVI